MPGFYANKLFSLFSGKTKLLLFVPQGNGEGSYQTGPSETMFVVPLFLHNL